VKSGTRQYWIHPVRFLDSSRSFSTLSVTCVFSWCGRCCTGAAARGDVYARR
jgi:hypothetical protein